MLIAQLADAHIGHRQYGLEERAKDYEKAFIEAINKIVQLRHEKDLKYVIICGDLFDTSRPTPNDYVTVINGLRKLREENVNVIIIRGNHEASITSPSNNPLQVISSMNLATYLENNYLDIGRVRVIGIGCVYSDLQSRIERYLEKCVNPNAINIVMMHQYLEETPYTYALPNMDYYMVSLSIFKRFYDKISYIALGHLHEHELKHPKLPAVYSGSLEIWDSREFETYVLNDNSLRKIKDMSIKGFLVLDVDETSGKVYYEAVKLRHNRRMIRIFINYSELTPLRLRRDIQFIVDNFDKEHAYLSIEVNGKLASGYSSRDLNITSLRKLFRKVLKVDIKLNLTREIKGFSKISMRMLGVNDIIKNVLTQLLQDFQNRDKVITLILSMLDHVDSDDLDQAFKILEEELKVPIKGMTSIISFFSEK